MSNAIATTAKRCSACRTVKPLTEFHKAGEYPRCKACVRESNREQYAVHRQQNLERARLWREANPEKARENNKAYHQANRDRRRDYARKRMDDFAALAQSHLARAIRAGVPVTGVVDLEQLWVAQEGVCAICRVVIDPNLRWPDQFSKSVDHIIPVSRGGHHSQENVQWTHVDCNRRKAKRLPDELEESA